MKKKIKKYVSYVLLVLLIASFSLNMLYASEEHHASGKHDNEQTSSNTKDKNHHEDSDHQKSHHKQEFEPKSFLFHHIQDAHQWHIITLPSGKDIFIPLPIIVYSKHSGLHVFMSSKLHGGSHEHLHIPHHGEHAGDIVETLPSGETYTPLDFSITKNVAAAMFSILLMLWVFISIANRYKKHPHEAPRGKQSFLEPIILFIRDDIAKPSIGDKKYERFMPYLLTVFFFIWFNNMLGLIPIVPGGANVTGNISVTASLALFTFLITQFNGNKNYWKHIFNTPGVPVWLKVPPLPLMPIIEFLGMFLKPFTLLIRLFANITGGHIIVLSFFTMIFIFGKMNAAVGLSSTALIIPFTIFMTFLELLVALIQAYVFTMLSALYFGVAVEEHH